MIRIFLFIVDPFSQFHQCITVTTTPDPEFQQLSEYPDFLSYHKIIEVKEKQKEKE